MWLISRQERHSGPFIDFLRSAVIMGALLIPSFHPSTSYAQPAQPVRIEVHIQAVHDVPVTEGAVCGFTEYYGRVRFNSGRWIRTARHSLVPGGGDFIFPSPFDIFPAGWVAPFVATIPARSAGGVATRVDVQVWEYDEFPCGGDDQLDIAPGRPKTVSFRVLTWRGGECLVTDVPGFSGVRGAFS